MKTLNIYRQKVCSFDEQLTQKQHRKDINVERRFGVFFFFKVSPFNNDFEAEFVFSIIIEFFVFFFFSVVVVIFERRKIFLPIGKKDENVIDI